MDIIKVTDVTVSNDYIKTYVSVEGEVSNAFKKTEFSFDYTSNLSLNEVPKSVAVLPAVGTLLPLAWLFNARLEVDECDADFINSIPDIKKGYMNMYPGLEFGGKFIFKKAVENKMDTSEGSMSFFSGGLDSHDTVLRHADEKPDLLILRGADISILPKDDGGWQEILHQVDNLAEMIGSNRISVVTNFRDVMNYRFLNDWAADIAGTDGTYWYCFQHGLAITTHAAPVSWKKRIKKIYIASSYTEDDEGKTTCASDPSIDNYVRFNDAAIYHDGYAFARIDKLRNVSRWCKENKKKVFLRVCHSRPKGTGTKSKDGRNCCKCEKCYRTILGLYALREDPSDYGFEYDSIDKLFASMHSHAYRMVRIFNLRYLPIIDEMHNNYKDEEVRESIRWFYDFKLTKDSEYFKWVDRRIAIEHEKRIAAEIKATKAERSQGIRGIIRKMLKKV